MGQAGHKLQVKQLEVVRQVTSSSVTAGDGSAGQKLQV